MSVVRLASLLLAALLVVPLLSSCGSDEEESACDKAFAAWCACPMVSCSGHPESCTGPDKTWADCINAAADPCAASCTP